MAATPTRNGASVDHDHDINQPLLPVTSPKSKDQVHRSLTLLPLVALIFFEVSGGPFGTEDAVVAAGPFYTLLGLCVFPILWSVPEALITAEMATTFPENSGFVAWVTAAFGPFWGFQEGLWSWISGVTDNSLYPVMLAANLEIFFPQLASGWPRLAFLVGLSLLLSFLNYRGLTVVGNTVITYVVAILVPFALLVALGLPRATPANWLIRPAVQDVDWGTFINIMFWNLNYWDSVATLAGEVRNPGRTFPRALMIAVLLVVLMYVLPALAALGVNPNTQDWKLGYYGQVAQQVGGNWLAVWVLVAAACSQVGQYQAEMASDSYQVLGMAERGFLPLALGQRSAHGTPTIGILLSSLGVLSLASLNFVQIVELLNAIYCMAELLEFTAFIYLRIKAPKLHRPYRIPLPTWALVLMLLPTYGLLLFVLLLPFYNLSWPTMAATTLACLSGFVIYPMLQAARNRGWCSFNDLHFECAGVYGPAGPVPDHREHTAVDDIMGLVRGSSTDVGPGSEAAQGHGQAGKRVCHHHHHDDDDASHGPGQGGDSETAPLLGVGGGAAAGESGSAAAAGVVNGQATNGAAAV